MSVITVRMDEGLHDALVELAHDRRQSLNRMCVEILVKAVARHDLGATRDGPDPDILPMNPENDRLIREKPR